MSSAKHGVLECDGDEITRMKASLDNSYDMLEENYEELCEANLQYLNDWSIVEPKNCQKLNHFFRKFQKLLFDYLSSFSSYVDHTRHFVRHVKNPEFAVELNRIKEEKRFVEKTQFIKDLRNYSHHVELPVPGARLDYMVENKGPAKGQIVGVFKGELSLRKEDLLKWKRLSPISRDFLQKYPEEEIIIVSYAKIGFVDQCQIATKELYDWLHLQIQELT
jgi:hypothetical protein